MLGMYVCFKKYWTSPLLGKESKPPSRRTETDDYVQKKFCVFFQKANCMSFAAVQSMFITIKLYLRSILF